jgi:hypothetical protein
MLVHRPGASTIRHRKVSACYVQQFFYIIGVIVVVLAILSLLGLA